MHKDKKCTDSAELALVCMDELIQNLSEGLSGEREYMSKIILHAIRAGIFFGYMRPDLAMEYWNNIGDLCPLDSSDRILN